MDIYVGNLSYDTTDADLQQLFKEYGEVASARVITDRLSGRSKGFGFIEMPEQADAEKAIENINGSDLQGRTLRVNESRPKPRGTGSREHGGGGGGGGGGGRRY